jgi:hypothetical protein
MAGMALTPEATLVEQQLQKMEQAVAPRPPGWAWILVGLGLLMAIGLGAHAATAYMTIDHVNQISHLPTLNPVLLLQDLGTNGTRVSANVDGNSRGVYGKALTQYVLDGTGVCLGIALAFGGLFIRLNR